MKIIVDYFNSIHGLFYWHEKKEICFCEDRHFHIMTGTTKDNLWLDEKFNYSFTDELAPKNTFTVI